MSKYVGVAPDLEQRVYVTHELHRYLAEDAWKPEGPNIGSHGENLTIAFLSLERPTLSVRLVRSIGAKIADFAGEILVIDNGSSESARDTLSRELGGMPFRWRLVALGQNQGVAGGRNRGMEHVATDWVMWLDNDVYFVSNPLPRIQSDLAQLGCHFMSVPLLQSDGRVLSAMGGHLYVKSSNGELSIGVGSTFEQKPVDVFDGPGFLSTFLSGGACICNVRSFVQAGGYDAEAHVGFEDTDFSLRLFRAGMKVGTTGAVSLVHDHPAPETGLDYEYEAGRFRLDVLKESARHFEEKYGFRFWSEATTKWLRARRSALGLSNDDEPLPENRAPAKSKIALVVDVDNWAFFNIASQLVRLLSDRFEFSIVAMQVLGENIVKMLLMCEDRDLIHVFWRGTLSQLEHDQTRRDAAALGYDYKYFLDRFLRSKAVTTSVFDHLLLEPEKLSAREHVFARVVTAYAVSSWRLQGIYLDIPRYPPPAAVLQDGVDLRLFQPIRLDRLARKADDPLVVGWVGNSEWRSESRDKGVHTILRPVLNELSGKGKPVSWSFADRAECPIPYAEMPDYYGAIDVLVCCSKTEGTPNPVLEAMACGVPVISTDVGIVPEVFGPLQRHFILPERTTDALKSALLRLIENRELLSQLSSENLASIRQWDWSIRASAYGEFFASALARHRTRVS